MFTASKRILGLIGFTGSVLASVNAPVYLQGTDESLPRLVTTRDFAFAGGCRPALSCTGVFFQATAEGPRRAPDHEASGRATSRGGDEDWIPEETSTPAPSEVKEASSAETPALQRQTQRRLHRLETLRTRKAMSVKELARRRGCDPEVLARINGISVEGRFEAQRDVLLFDGPLRLYRVRKGDSLWHVHRRFGIHTACILYLNRMAETRIWPGQTLLLPEGPISPDSEDGVKSQPWIRRLLTPKNYVLRPVPGRLTSPFGWRRHPVLKRRGFHTGIDISAPRGTPIRAVDSGTVRRARDSGPLGLCVVLSHDDGFHTSYYGHCSKLLVEMGEKVVAGQVIALVGRTGRATGHHVHFGLKRGDHFVNPTRNLDLRTPGPRPAQMAKR